MKIWYNVINLFLILTKRDEKVYLQIYFRGIFIINGPKQLLPQNS
ncbi:hypothetical protein Cs308_0500 [Candidatus Chlamydia sanziniae]|uniref:Uncharacterized protein n=1 Tax=Candidatus Chlamydia sanziniae TaxID=1806891 RepID=A0A1A9HW73_9CHLA|nr:hypothetical protein Cs308_0500 [Candidatus Chlamydia sanziniae]